MSPNGRRVLVVGLAVIVVVVAVFASRLRVGSDPAASPVIGAPVPDLALPRLDGGGSVGLRDLAGEHEVVVINFFASWCLQCHNEHADLVATADAYLDRGVRFLGIVFSDDPDRATAFLDEKGRGLSTRYLNDPGSRAAIEFGVFGVPETVFVADGIIVGKFLGETDALTLGAALEKLLSGQSIDSRQVGDFRRAPDDGA